MFTNADGDYVSGQKISDLLGCSRTAVWKHIEELRKDGYELEAVRKRLSHCWEAEQSKQQRAFIRASNNKNRPVYSL